MNIARALETKRQLDREHILVAYNGYLSDKVLVSLSEILTEKLRIDDLGPNLNKRVFSLFCEQAQNIIRYSADRIVATDSTQYGNGLVAVGYGESAVYILCGNLIERGDRPTVESRLAELMDMDDDQLRRYYKQKLKSDSDPGSQGASVGLIEIVRRSSYPIEYDFVDYDDRKVFFCLKAFA